MLTHSTDIDQVATALAKAQAAMGHAIKDAMNPAFRSKYADLAAVRDATNGPLSGAGIACVQAPAVSPEGTVSVETRLIHTSGQWLACTVSARAADGKPQSVGSAITYLRRYGLLALVGIAPDDDDGNAASGKSAPHREAPDERAARQSQHHPSWDGDRGAFMAAIEKVGVSYDLACDFCEWLGKPRPSQLSHDDRGKFLAYLSTDAGQLKLRQMIHPNEGK